MRSSGEEDLRIVSNGHSWRWKCSCGTSSGRWDSSEEEALKAGRRHFERHRPRTQVTDKGLEIPIAKPGAVMREIRNVVNPKPEPGA